MSVYPKIKTRLPGPKSKRIIKQDEKYVSPSYTRTHPVVIDRGEGAALWDVDGNRFLDFHSGIGVTSTGNVHPRVVGAAIRQMKRAMHVATADFYHQPVADLAKKITSIAPGKGPKRVFFTNSGTEAVEAAFKLARYNRRRPRTIAFINAFHGRTMGALSLTCSKRTQRLRFAPLVPEVTHVPYAYCYRCPYHLSFPSCNFHCVQVIEDVYLNKVAPAEEVAALIVEPIQGEGGYVVPPPGYHQRLKKMCEKHDILFIADEVQSGMGKTGKMFAIEHWGTVPDIIAAAKALGSGLPIGAAIASAKLMSWDRGAHSTTFGGNPVACAAALETIKLLEGGLMRNAERIGRVMMEQLSRMMHRHDIIGDVRGKGLMIGAEIVRDKKSKKPAPDWADDIMMEAFRRGLMLLTAGLNTLRIVPPLIISEDQAMAGLSILEKSITAVESRKKK